MHKYIWRRGLVVRTLVFDWRTFPDLTVNSNEEISDFVRVHAIQ